MAGDGGGREGGGRVDVVGGLGGGGIWGGGGGGGAARGGVVVSGAGLIAWGRVGAMVNSKGKAKRGQARGFPQRRIR